MWKLSYMISTTNNSYPGRASFPWNGGCCGVWSHGLTNPLMWSILYKKCRQIVVCDCNFLNRSFFYSINVHIHSSIIKSIYLFSELQSIVFVVTIFLPINYTCTSLFVPWWRHQMETFSALLVLCVVTGEFPLQMPVTRSFDFFSWSVWINGWVTNREAEDLRRHRDHYYVTVTWINALRWKLIHIT